MWPLSQKLLLKAQAVKYGPLKGDQKAGRAHPALPLQAQLAPHDGWRVCILKHLNAAEDKNYLQPPTKLAAL